MSRLLQVNEGLQFQGSGASIVWQIDVANWTSTPASPAVRQVIDEKDGADVVGTVMPIGSPSIVDTTKVKLQALTALTAGHTYRIHFIFTYDGNTDEAILRVHCPW